MVRSCIVCRARTGTTTLYKVPEYSRDPEKRETLLSAVDKLMYLHVNEVVYLCQEHYLSLPSETLLNDDSNASMSSAMGRINIDSLGSSSQSSIAQESIVVSQHPSLTSSSRIQSIDARPFAAFGSFSNSLSVQNQSLSSDFLVSDPHLTSSSPINRRSGHNLTDSLELSYRNNNQSIDSSSSTRNLSSQNEHDLSHNNPDLTQNVSNLLHQLELAKTRIKKLVQSNRCKNTTIFRLRKELKVLRKKKDPPSFEKTCMNNLNEPLLSIVLDQLRNKSKPLQARRYRQETKKFTMSVQFLSNKTVRLLRDGFKLCLPSVTTVNRITCNWPMRSGLNPQMIEALSPAISNLTGCERAVVLTLDEMAIDPDVMYDIKHDEVIGLDGLYEEGKFKFARHALAFMVSSFLSRCLGRH